MDSARFTFRKKMDAEIQQKLDAYRDEDVNE